MCCVDHTVSYEKSISNSFYFNPVSPNEIINTLTSLYNSHAIGTDGLHPDIIKTTADLISFQSSFIFNLSFSQGIFPTLLKSTIVIPNYKNG